MKEELKLFLTRLWPLWLILFGLPILSFGIWLIKPSTTLEILVVDKTVPNFQYREHKSIFWVFDYLKIKKSSGEPYDKEIDYLGFFPNEKPDHGSVKDLKGKSDTEISDLVSKKDIIYLADTYGVYEDDFRKKVQGEISNKIYGGLTVPEVELIHSAKEQKKTLIAEYNSMASPTAPIVRAEFERLMGVKWTGWIARFFDELDSLQNDELPQWLLRQYVEQHNRYDLAGPGLIFVKETGEIEAFLIGRDFTNTTPMIRTQKMNKPGYKLPELVPYPDWFDIVLIERDYQVISYFDIGPTLDGVQKLRSMGLPRFFPASVVRNIEGARQFYFSGDFADFGGSLGTPNFQGLPFFWRGLYIATDYTDRNSFFWNYYYPLLSQILQEEQNNKKKSND